MVPERRNNDETSKKIDEIKVMEKPGVGQRRNGRELLGNIPGNVE